MLSDDALERRRKGGKKKKKEQKASGLEDGSSQEGKKGGDVGVLEGMTNGFFVARHLPGAVDLKSTPFPSKPGSKATGFPFDLLPRSRALRSKSNATSFFPNGWTRRSLEMVYPRDDIADIFVYEGAAHHHSFGVRFEGRN